MPGPRGVALGSAHLYPRSTPSQPEDALPLVCDIDFPDARSRPPSRAGPGPGTARRRPAGRGAAAAPLGVPADLPARRLGVPALPAGVHRPLDPLPAWRAYLDRAGP